MAGISLLQGDLARPFLGEEALMSVSLDLCLNRNFTCTGIFVLITNLLFLKPIIVPDTPDQILQ